MRMEVIEAQLEQRGTWNDFVIANFPPVGAFLESWEWGEFKERLGTDIKRFIVKDGPRWLAAAAFERHAAPLGVCYLYAPRGPVLDRLIIEDVEKVTALFRALESRLKDFFRQCAFARFEPPFKEEPLVFFKKPFYLPRYYIQPRYNTTVNLAPPEAEILGAFSRDMRQDVRAAERRGTQVKIMDNFDAGHYAAFQGMQKDTSGRAGKNVYPSRAYYDALFVAFSPFSKMSMGLPAIGAFFAFADSLPVACHVVVFFGKTATYLYGASYSGKESSKATSYLHWIAMREAKARGCEWYDLGGIDSARWPSLTYFKRQFNGREFQYIGNADMVFRPAVYRFYNFLRRLRYPEK